MAVEDTSQRAPLTKVEYPYEYRFQMPPPPPTFGVWGSLASIFSLVVMTLLSTVMLLQLLDPSTTVLAGTMSAFDKTAFGTLLLWLAPPQSQSPMPVWTWLPFAFTIFGASVGALFELYLLIDGTAFQQMKSKGTIFILKIRLLNLAPVTATILFFLTCMLVHDPSLRLAMMLGSAALCFGLGMALFFGGGEKVVPLLMLGIQALGAIMVLVADVPLGGEHVKMFLIAQPIFQAIALLIGTSTPLKSTGFHLIATASGLMLYCALLLQTAVAPNFAHAVAVDVPLGSLRFWALLAACAGGLLFTIKMSPRTYNAYRSAMSDIFWSLQYFLLVSAPRFPNPMKLSEVYKNRPEPATLRPYYVQHPAYLPEPLSVPAPEKLEPDILAFQDLVKKAKQTFAVIAFADHNFPQADSQRALADKPRLEIWSSGANYWPGIYRKKIFGLTLPDPEPPVAPPAAIEAYKAGQQLAYLCESGVGSTMLARGQREGELVLDLRFLDSYETKPDYESYGGQAIFYIDAKAERLVLRSVIAPHTTLEIAANPDDATFRRAEAMVVASLYYYVVSGKHLSEIHMTYNLVEVAMYNAFDAQGQWTHPVRTVLYLHTFSHELAEELTTEHLVQEGAVFTQIFATTHRALIQHLNDSYESFEYGKDEDFEARAELMRLPSESLVEGKLLPKSAIKWELDMVKIWTRYANALVDIIYEDDAAVVGDRYMQDLFQELSVVLTKPLPPRYAKLQTKAGVSRFISDTAHHLVVRHQVYGTTGVPGLDPRIASTQVPRDGGTSGVDEWRSLAGVALATAHARFVLLLGDFKYLLDDVDAKYRGGMRDVYDRLQEDLRVLDAEWTSTDENKDFNRNYFRAVPSDMHTGPGY
jgi:hypothetical protein